MKETPSAEQNKLQDRLANLLGNTAVIKIGGTTQDALRDNRYKVETALQSVHWALAHGYVIGGGLTHYNAAEALETDSSLTSVTRAEKIGIRAVQSALKTPMQSLLNTGRETMRDFENNCKNQAEMGFNLASKKYENLRIAGVLDAAQISASAVQIAFSHAQTILETTSWDTIRPNLPFL